MKKLKKMVMEKQRKYLRRKTRVNAIVKSVSESPRLIVNKSNKYTYAQIVSLDWKVIASASDLKVKEWTKVVKATSVWVELAKKALEKWVERVVFDRNWYIYHGRVKAIAEWARQGWLKF